MDKRKKVVLCLLSGVIVGASELIMYFFGKKDGHRESMQEMATSIAFIQTLDSTFPRLAEVLKVKKDNTLIEEFEDELNAIKEE